MTPGGRRLSVAWHCSHESYQPEQLVGQARAAEAAGFDMVMASDHFHPWVDDAGAAGFVWSWFGAVAAATSRVRIGSNVTCPLFHYHPALIAQAAATCDRLSGGRFVLGVGTGENLNEGPLGSQFPGHRERLARLDEAIGVLERLLDGQKVSMNSGFYRLNGARLYSPPLRRVPILVAASGPRTAALAGYRADGLITAVRDVERVRSSVIEPYVTACLERGAEPLVVANRWCVLARNDDEAIEVLRPMRGLWARGRMREVDPAVLREQVDAMDVREILANYAVVESVDQIVDVYRPLIHRIRANTVVMQVATREPEDVIRSIGERVLPALLAEAGSAG